MDLTDGGRSYSPEGRTGELHLVQLFLDAHGDDLARGSVSLDAECQGVRISNGGVAARVSGARSRLSARQIIDGLRQGRDEWRLIPESISEFGRAGSERGWWTACFGVERPTEVPDEFWTDWSYGFPVEKTLAVLDALAAQGWRVARVSEDRGLYRGDDAESDSSVTTCRHWLVRTGESGER